MKNTVVFTAKVITSNAGSYTVTVAREGYSTEEPDLGNLIQGIPIAPQISNFIGFKEAFLPQPGNRVICISSSANTCYVMGVIPQNEQSSKYLPNRAELGAGDAGADLANRLGHETTMPAVVNNRRPTDVVDGEKVVSNEFGVLMGLYQQLVLLKASELSQVQCHLLDDLVRIISHNFQHYSALGEYNIYHDGKSIMAEFGATHLPGETYGRPLVESDQGAPIFQTGTMADVKDDQDFYKIAENESIKGIERFKIFLGRLGDFLHVFLSRPDPSEVRTLDPSSPPTKPDTGLFDFHLGADGAFHVRTAKECFIEKTSWIRVPHRTAAPDDPKGDDADAITYDEKLDFEWVDDNKYKENPTLYFLQLRDYVAYVTEKLAYQNFKKHPKDFYVNDSINKENSLKTIDKVDNETHLGQENYVLRRAGLYFMPNGGVMIKDAWGSATVWEGGKIYHQPATDYVVQPLRNYIAKVGGFTSIASRKDIDLSSSDEGFRVKTKKAQYYYSDKSGMIFEAHPESGGPGGFSGDGSRPVEDINGIVFKSTKGIYNYAVEEMVSYSKGNMMMQTEKGFDISTKQDFSLYSKANMFLLADQRGTISTRDLYAVADVSFMAGGKNSTTIGQKDKPLGIQYDKESPFIDILRGAVDLSTITDSLDAIKTVKEDLLKLTVFQESSKFDDLKFRFLQSNQYGELQNGSDAIPSTIAQQEDKLSSFYSLESWNEPEINGSLPFPGKDKFSSFYAEAGAPVNLEANNLGKDYSNKADSGNKAAKITFASLNNYKVQKTT